MTVEQYTVRSNRSLLVRYGFPSINIAQTEFNRRELLVPGTYEPSDQTAGPLSDTPRTVVTNNYVITTPGAVLKDLDIFGTVEIRTTDVTIDNCIVRGTVAEPSGERGLIHASNGAVRRLLVRDTLLQPQVPHYKWNGITGHNYTAKRVITRDTTDGFGVFNTNDPGGQLNTSIIGSWVDKMVYWTEDGGIHTDGTHNDCIQIQGGFGLVVVGNRLDAYLNTTYGNTRVLTDEYASRYNNHALSVLMVNNNNGVGPTGNLTVTDNWMRGGDIGINAGSDRLAGAALGSYLRNKFGKDQRLMGGSTPYTLNIDANAGSFDVGAGTANRNTYIDDGTEVALRRG